MDNPAQADMAALVRQLLNYLPALTAANNTGVPAVGVSVNGGSAAGV